jgi:hypothetical protein
MTTIMTPVKPQISKFQADKVLPSEQYTVCSLLPIDSVIHLPSFRTKRNAFSLHGPKVSTATEMKFYVRNSSEYLVIFSSAACSAYGVKSGIEVAVVSGTLISHARQ